MTRQDAKRLLANVEFMKAFAEGKTVQYNEGTEAKPDWQDIANPSFDMSTVFYRVKPEPDVSYIIEGLRDGQWRTWTCVFNDITKANAQRDDAARQLTGNRKPYFTDVRIRTFIEQL